MATPGELVDAVSAALRKDRASVEGAYRILREKKLVTKGGRGRSAPQVTVVDGAQVLIGVAASEAVKDSARAAKAFGSLVAYTFTSLHDRFDESDPGAPNFDGRWTLPAGLTHLRLNSLKPRHRLVDAISALLDSFADEESHGKAERAGIFPRVSVRFSAPEQSADIVIGRGLYRAQMAYRNKRDVLAHGDATAAADVPNHNAGAGPGGGYTVERILRNEAFAKVGAAILGRARNAGDRH